MKFWAGSSLLNMAEIGEKEKKQERAKAAMVQFQEGLAKDGSSKYLCEEYLPWAAWKANEFDVARQSAKFALDAYANSGASFKNGDLLFVGHSILGLLDLRDGNVKSSIAHLLASANSKGSPVLNSFGPEFDLARALYEKGERDSIVQFLKEVEKFWKREKVESWLTMIQEGEQVDLYR
jgi:hypothetical protein